MDSEIEEADSTLSQLNFVRPLELCDFMYLELQKWRKRSQSQFNHFNPQSSALIDALAKWKKEYWDVWDSQIEEADSAPSQLNFEGPLRLGNFLCLQPQRVKEGVLELRNLRLLSQFADRQPCQYKLYLFFYIEDSTVMYTLYEIRVPKPFPPPPTEAAQDANKWDVSELNLILQFETGMYPEGMCCVQLGSELYFFGGEFNLNKPNIRIYEDLKEKVKNVRRDVLPRDVYIFYSTLYREYPFLLCRLNEDMLLQGRPMNSGKASPQAFVADEKIYVIGSTFNNLDNKSFAYFEVYDPVEGMWTVLPNPPILDVNTRWVGNAVVGRKAVLVALQLGQERLYCFDLGTRLWTNRVIIPDFLCGNFFSDKTEFIEDSLYGCYYNTVGAIAPLANNEDEDEEEEGEEEEGERLLNNHRLHLVSGEMGMDAIFNIPRMLQSSSSLLHLENRYFCYVRAGAPPPLRTETVHSVSIVIFQALVGETYKENAIDTRFFRAKFVYSKDYNYFLQSIKGLFIKGCYALG
ncbi:uncharacterized protein LOC142621757 [Castanea sativa]|uniref:uncharacterized protein LOC142621757 n=1 Tax=Castanea sativa TaxID=21020 RepID=UPI003F652AD4